MDACETEKTNAINSVSSEIYKNGRMVHRPRRQIKRDCSPCTLISSCSTHQDPFIPIPKHKIKFSDKKTSIRESSAAMTHPSSMVSETFSASLPEKVSAHGSFVGSGIGFARVREMVGSDVARD